MRKASGCRNFADRVANAVEAKGSALVVGLDPDLRQLPEGVMGESARKHGHGERGLAQAVVTFNEAIMDAVADLVPAVKPQLAYYEALGPAGIAAYRRTVAGARRRGLLVIADAKRADIGSTTEAYAKAFFGPEGDGRREPAWAADALTVQPYLGRDGLAPLIARCQSGKGLFVLVRTSNPGAAELQDLKVDGGATEGGGLPGDGCSEALFHSVGRAVARWGAELKGESGYSAVGAVVGATDPESLRLLRAQLPGVLFLVPGFGAQGGSADELRGCFDERGLGAVVNSSRGIIFAYRTPPYRERYDASSFAAAAREACVDATVAINRARFGQGASPK